MPPRVLVLWPRTCPPANVCVCVCVCVSVSVSVCVCVCVCCGRTQHPDLHLRETLLEQIEWCKQRKMKKQKETLLLVLQVASARDAGVRGV